MIKYVFFDLDETLIDIKYAQNMAIVSLYKKFGFDKETDVNSFAKVWDDLTEFHYADYTQKRISYEEQRKRRVVDLFDTFDIEMPLLPLEVYDVYLKFFEKNWICFEDVEITLKMLKSKGYKLGIISNGDYSQQVQKLKTTKIFDYFDYIETSSEFDVSKPNTKLYEKVFEKNNISPEEVFYVGDSYNNDYFPCTKLKIKSVLLSREGLRDYDLAKQITTLTDLIKLL